jgi:hypothetical protein
MLQEKGKMRSFGITTGCVALLLAIALVGCSRQNPSMPAEPQQESATQAETGGDSEITAALAKLSADDRALAEAQKICPVSKELLGSMGAPIKVTVEGKDVFVCCEGCVEELKSDPAKFLAEIGKGS